MLEIGNNHKVFIICEIGVCHNGSLDTAKRLIDAAVSAKADAAKFQAWRTHPDDPYASLNLTIDQLAETQAYARGAGITWICTPHDPASVDDLEALEVPLYKVGSAGLANPELLRRVGATGKPTIMSTGMATEDQISRAFHTLNVNNDDCRVQRVIMHTVNGYPTPLNQLNLGALHRLRQIYGWPLGYSDHSGQSWVAAFAVAAGAQVIEAHITLSQDQDGPDHRASLTPAAFRRMVLGVRRVERVMGAMGPRASTVEPQPAEAELRKQVWGR